MCCVVFFFFKQKTAYEMRISDWSSDVCSSDLESMHMPLPAILARNLRLPVISSPMFLVSNPQLVIAQCKAGIVGSFPALNARPASPLAAWLAEITEALAAYDRVNHDRLHEQFDVK